MTGIAMKNEMDTQQHIYFPMSIEAASHAYHLFSCHTLACLYSGRLYLRNQCGETLRMEQGDSAFIGRDSYAHLYAEPEQGKPCRGLFFSFPREFLCEFYQALPASNRESSATELPALHLLESTAETRSLFQSWFPYIQGNRDIPDKMLRLKMAEAVYALLNTNERYIPTLFDFAGKCRMDMFDLLQKPIEKEIRWQEFAFEPYSKPN